MMHIAEFRIFHPGSVLLTALLHQNLATMSPFGLSTVRCQFWTRIFFVTHRWRGRRWMTLQRNTLKKSWRISWAHKMVPQMVAQCGCWRRRRLESGEVGVGAEFVFHVHRFGFWVPEHLQAAVGDMVCQLIQSKMILIIFVDVFFDPSSISLEICFFTYHCDW